MAEFPYICHDEWEVGMRFRFEEDDFAHAQRIYTSHALNNIYIVLSVHGDEETRTIEARNEIGGPSFKFGHYNVDAEIVPQYVESYYW